jgi:hypothetical protein
VSDLQLRDAATVTTLNRLTEAGLARWRQKEGDRIVRHRGRYWLEPWRGFYIPVHLMARLTAEEATRPAALSWGFRAALAETELTHSNGSIPIYLLNDLENYDQRTSATFRRHVRQSLKQVRFVEVTGPALLREQGWRVAMSSMQRVGGTFKTKEEYEANLDAYVCPERRLILAGLVDSRLAGYIVCQAVDESAYVEFAYHDAELMSTNVGAGLLHEFIQICRRSLGIRQIIHGLHTPEKQGLEQFKISAGFSIARVPAKVEINPIAAALMKRRMPYPYYRLTGRSDHIPNLTSENGNTHAHHGKNA